MPDRGGCGRPSAAATCCAICQSVNARRERQRPRNPASRSSLPRSASSSNALAQSVVLEAVRLERDAAVRDSRGRSGACAPPTVTRYCGNGQRNAESAQRVEHEVLEDALAFRNVRASDGPASPRTFFGLRPGARAQPLAARSRSGRCVVSRRRSASSAMRAERRSDESRRQIDDRAFGRRHRNRARRGHHVRSIEQTAAMTSHACETRATARCTVVTSSAAGLGQRRAPRVGHAVSCDANACFARRRAPRRAPYCS